MQESIERKNTSSKKEQEALAAANIGRGVSNSAVSAIVGVKGQSSASSTAELGKALSAKLPSNVQAQIPRAEAEADNLSAGIAAKNAVSVKAELGAKLGTDFSNINIHTDSNARASADAVGARAYTSGHDIFFGSGGFDPQIAAHELVHTAQQGAASSGSVSVSAPMGGVQMWPWSKKKTPAANATAPAISSAGGVAGGASALASAPKQSFGDKAYGFFSGIGNKITSWADKRSGETVDPSKAEQQQADITAAMQNMFDEDAAQAPAPAPEKKKGFFGRAGDKIKSAGSYVGSKVKGGVNKGLDYVAKKISSAKRKNERAVDQFNDFNAEYNSMSRFDRFKWSVQNPLARMTASRRKAGTEERNKRAELIEEESKKYRAQLTGEDRTEAYEHSGNTDPAAAPAAGGAPQSASQEEDEDEDEDDSGIGDFVESVTDTGSQLMELSSGEAAESMGGNMSLVNNAIGIKSNFDAARERRQMGDKLGTVTNAIRTVASAGGVAGDLGLEDSVPFLPIITDSANTVADTADAIGAGMRRNKMGNRSKQYEQQVASGKKLNKHDETTRRILAQAKGAATADTIQSSTAAVGNAIKTASTVAAFSGAGLPVGMALNLAGTVVSSAGESAAASQRKAVRAQVADEEKHIEKRIERFMRDHPEFTYRDAKHIVIKGLGYSSGKRSEVAGHATIKRTDELIARATAGDAEAIGILKDMGVSPVDGQYNRKFVGERLAMPGEGKTLEDQLGSVAASRSKANPFKSKK